MNGLIDGLWISGEGGMVDGWKSSLGFSLLGKTVAWYQLNSFVCFREWRHPAKLYCYMLISTLYCNYNSKHLFRQFFGLNSARRFRSFICKSLELLIFFQLRILTPYTFWYSEGGRPLGPQDVEADAAVAVDVGVVDLRRERNLRMNTHKFQKLESAADGWCSVRPVEAYNWPLEVWRGSL